MSNRYEIGKPVDALEVIRLKVDGAPTAVNTLRDQQTARGLSLICPFPALEVDIPVSFGAGGDDPRQSGTIHRIGVEDDPETGLPRLRLSVRAHNSRATVVAPPDQGLLREASRMTAVPEECAKTDLDLISQGPPPLPAGLHATEARGPVDEAPAAFDDPFLAMLDVKDGKEPQWAKCAELPLPAKMVDRGRTRRRQRAGAAMAWLAILVACAAGGWILDRAGVIDVESIRDGIAGLTVGATEPTAAIEVAKLEPDGAEVGEKNEELALEASPEIASALEPAVEIETVSEVSSGSLDEDAASPMPLASEPMDFESAVVLASESDAPAEAMVDAVAPAAKVDEAAAPSSANGSEAAGEITLVLPTRWPAEYANAYRLRDPNGVVVDVPGGLVKKEGWLDVGREYPMIRSVKAVQRETGARFVVFINGELPRFMTASRTNGVALRLLFGEEGEPGTTEQVALLSR